MFSPYKASVFSLPLSLQTWDYIIPYWLESIRTEVKPDDYRELEILLKWVSVGPGVTFHHRLWNDYASAFLSRKVFDATAGPFPFLPAKVYHFAGERFIDATAPVQDQVLSWLEVRRRIFFWILPKFIAIVRHYLYEVKRLRYHHNRGASGGGSEAMH